jgi:hypothetical protein
LNKHFNVNEICVEERIEMLHGLLKKTSTFFITPLPFSPKIHNSPYAFFRRGLSDIVQGGLQDRFAANSGSYLQKVIPRDSQREDQKASAKKRVRQVHDSELKNHPQVSKRKVLIKHLYFFNFYDLSFFQSKLM